MIDSPPIAPSASANHPALPPLPPTPWGNSTISHDTAAADTTTAVHQVNDLVNPDNAAAVHMEVNNPDDDEYSGIMPNFDQSAEDFDAGEGALSTVGALAQNAGFDAKYVKIVPSSMPKSGLTFIKYDFRFKSQDGTVTAFQAKADGNKFISNAIEFAYNNNLATRGELNLGVLVSQDAINLANAMSYPTNECAVIIKNIVWDGQNREGLMTRILHLKTGVIANNHRDFCALSGISLDTIMSHDVVSSKINTALLGLPFQGSDAFTTKISVKISGTGIQIYHSDGSFIGGLNEAYDALRIVQHDVLRLATNAMMELRGISSVKQLWQSSVELSSICSKQNFAKFLNQGANLRYTGQQINHGKTTFGPYKISTLVKYLYSNLTSDDYDANPVVAGLMLCLTQRVRLGDYLPRSTNSDYRLRQTAIDVVEVEGGGEENGLVYHPQRTDADYDVENGHGYSAVPIDTILVAKVNSLHDIDGEDIDVAIGDSDDFIVARYGGIQELGDGSDSIVLSVFYNKNVAGKVEKGEENVYLYASENEFLGDVVVENLYVVEFPGSLPTFYEESDQLEDLIKLRAELEGTTGTSEIGNDSDAESFDFMEVEQVEHV